MDYLIYLLLLFGISSCEESTTNVTIIWKAESLELKYNPPILFEKQQFRIIVESKQFNVKDRFSIKCNYESNKVFIDTELIINDEQRYCANVNTTLKAKEWHCTVTRKSNTTKDTSISFSPHIRSMKPGEIRVNDRNIALKSTDLSVSDYDAVGTYYYVKGELAKFTCHKLIYNYQALNFNLLDTEHMTSASFDVKLYLKLGHELSPNHIDCKISKSVFKNYIRLLLKPTDNIEYPQFEVNGLILTPSKNDLVHNYVFVYEYYPGENLTLISNLNSTKYKSLECTGFHLPDEIMHNFYNNSKLRLSIQTYPVLDAQASVDCLVKVGTYRNYNAKDVHISIKFVEESMKFSPNIIGIQWPKTIAKFYNNVYKKNGIIYASSNSNDNTTLHCSSEKAGVKWHYDAQVNSTLLTATNTESEYMGITKHENRFISSRTFQLIDNFTEATLECKRDSETSKVVLIQQIDKPSTQVTSTEHTESGNSNADVDETTNNYSSNIEGDSDDTPNKYLPLIIGVILIIIILLIIILIACIYKRKKLPKTDIDINYENLPAHNEGSMPLPRQWDTKSVENDNIEDAYAKVIPKNQRIKLADVYSELLASKMENCYATPYNANLESPYAEIIPQSERNENVPIEPENVGNYAEIVPKALRNVAKNRVLPTNNGTEMRNRVDTDKHKYANVSNSKVYANVSSSGC